MNLISRLLIAAVLTGSALISPTLTIPSASAQACPDVQVIFARGTFEPPGVGGMGQAFVDSLRSKVGNKSVDVYPVNYPASLDFATAADGVIDATNKVVNTAATCPNTKMVLGGFSQGAAVIGYITADGTLPGFTLPPGVSGPLPPNVANNVAAVALFGKPSNGWMQSMNRAAPVINVGPLYAAKTDDLCIPEDPICSPSGGDNGAHNMYAANGMTDQAADFAVRQLASSTNAR